ncbi:MAG: hypothetical protein JW983_09015 [Elusimicrobia bacterium]|nr:hypothetical protein [Elusimicrobiota bacterium]
MKMIKSFKINLRQGYILRGLKKRKIDITEEVLAEKLGEIQGLIKPATIYDTLKPEVFRGCCEAGKSIAVSFLAVTLGKDVETLEKNEITMLSLTDGLEIAQGFVMKLLQIEAEDERCNLAEAVELEPRKVFENQKLLKTIDFSKLDVSFSDNIVSPENTKFFTVNWSLRKKK